MIPEGGELEILLGLAGSFRRVPLASLAAVTHIPTSTLRESLSRLLLSFLDRRDESESSPEGEPTEGEVRNVSFAPIGNVQNPKRNETFETLPNVSSDACARGPEARTDLTGETLARALDDAASRPFYDQLVASVSPEILRRALDLTLSRRATIRGEPGAYFTGLVRRLANPTPYARTSPTSP